MRAFRDLSIRQKLTVMSVFASGTALLLACAAFLAYELITFREGMILRLSIRAEIVGANSASAILFNDEAAAVGTLTALKADPHTIAAGLYTRDNRIFATYVRDDQKEQVALPLHLADQTDGHRFEDDGLILSRKIVLKGEPIGTVYIHSDMTEMNARIWQYLGITLVVLLASSSVALFISSRLQRIVTRPLFHLVETAQTVSREKDYSVRAVTDSKDEMGILVNAFNEMLVQIQQQAAALQRSSDGFEQRVIERTQELESANKELETFSYSVSHDLRAPLRGIDGFCQALVEDCAERLDEQGKDYLKRIQAATVRMGQLVDDLLDLSKVNRAQVQRSKIDLSALARGLAKELQQRDPEREAEFRIQTGLVADADQQLMRIVLANLLENAWKFTSKQKRAQIEFAALPSAKETAYFVRDNGAGFDMAYVNKLFAPFQRLHTANQFPGTGIGLATVQRIILRHGGRVWAEGEKGNGASFYFSFSPHVPI